MWQVKPLQITDDKKRLFARALARVGKDKPFDAACAVFGTSNDVTGKCCQAAAELPDDPVVKAELDRLSQAGATELLPSKDETLLRIWQWTQDSAELKDKVAAMRLFAEMQGFIADPKAKQLDDLPPAINYYRDPSTLNAPSEIATAAE